MSRVVPAEGVIHVRWHCDSTRPWAGRSPLRTARLSAEVAAAAEISMKGKSLPSGRPGSCRRQAATLIRLPRRRRSFGKAAFEAWPGRARLADNLRADPKPEIMGPAPTPGTVDVRRTAAVEIAAACGIPPPLIDAQAAGQGQREAYRRFALLTIAPALRIAAAEIAGEARCTRLAPGRFRAGGNRPDIAGARRASAGRRRLRDRGGGAGCRRSQSARWWRSMTRHDRTGRRYRRARRAFLALHPYCRACRAKGTVMPERGAGPYRAAGRWRAVVGRGQLAGALRGLPR